MPVVIYETESARFELDREEIIRLLDSKADQFSAEDVARLKEALSSTAEVIPIPPDDRYFCFVALALLSSGQGQAFCKACQASYPTSSLTLEPLGRGTSPFNVKPLSQKAKKGLKDILGAVPKSVGGFGGKVYLCPKGHELISVTTWIA